ncbi:response regulator transcription factor [Blastococcus sp. URHD0036]|uniref:response regulator transcription factor n=1 Tax=Blastococcus sp. URHD0036 TaxID=1380356 RepID=UPI000495E09B|nr:response regulator transcription factor [Blastococcus sp. URHD0036]
MSAPQGQPDVLVVDDDEDIRVSLSRGLRLSGLAVRTAADATEALAAVAAALPDVIVLDVGLPGRDGIAVLEQLRTDGVGVPVLVLSARSAVDDRVQGLAAGADDYLVKPFALAELVARLRALLRRIPATAPAGSSVGPLTVDPGRRRATVDGVPVELTRREFDLLETLVRNAGLVLARERLLELVWGYDFAVDTNVVDVFVSQLRRKLEAGGAPRLVHTVRGIGFTLEHRG